LKVSILDTKLAKSHISIPAISLLVNSFPGDQKLLEFQFRKLFENFDDIFFVSIHDKHKLVGILTLIRNRIIFNDLLLHGVTLSYMAVEKNLVPGSVTKYFKMYVNQDLLSNYDYIIGFPRKIMKGYWEIQGFASSVIDDSARLYFSRIKQSSKNIKCELFRIDYFQEIKNIYLVNLNNFVVGELRSHNQWNRILSDFMQGRISIYIYVNEDDKVCGYLILRDKKAIEFSLLNVRSEVTNEILNSISDLGLSFLPVSSLHLDINLLTTLPTVKLVFEPKNIEKRSVVFKSRITSLENTFKKSLVADAGEQKISIFPILPLGYN
jgi:hypothetical protein